MRTEEQFVTAFFDIVQKIKIPKILDDFKVKYVRLLIYTLEINILQT